MAFNSSSAQNNAAGSSSGWSLESGWWPSSSWSGRSTLSSTGSNWSLSSASSDSLGSLTSSSVPVIVTPSSSHLYSGSDTASMQSTQMISSRGLQSSSLWSESSYSPTVTSILESSSATGDIGSSAESSESSSSSVWFESSSVIISSADNLSSSSVSSSSVSSSSVSSSSPSALSSSWSSLLASSGSPFIDFSASSSSSESEVLPTSTFSTRYTSFYPSSTISSYTSTSPPSYTVSRDSKSVYYIYTQLYHITGSTTTFDTGLPTTAARARTATSSFSVPTSTQTRGIQFYENWLDGDLDASSGPTNPQKNKIIGGVVGGVGGAILCGIIIWIMFFRRRKDKAEVTRGFTSEIGRRAGFPPPSQSVEHDQEKASFPVAGNGRPAFLSRMKSKAVAQMSKNKVEMNPQTEDGNPFQDEFNFQARKPPAVPPSRNNPGPYGSRPTAGQDVPVDHRFSYVSSMSDSSYISSAQGDYSTMSSTSIRLASDGARNHSESSHGFLREVI